MFLSPFSEGGEVEVVMNLLDLVLVLVLIAVMTAAVRLGVSRRKKGKGCHGCGGDCCVCGAAQTPASRLEPDGDSEEVSGEL